MAEEQVIEQTETEKLKEEIAQLESRKEGLKGVISEYDRQADKKRQEAEKKAETPPAAEPKREDFTDPDTGEPDLQAFMRAVKSEIAQESQRRDDADAERERNLEQKDILEAVTSIFSPEFTDADKANMSSLVQTKLDGISPDGRATPAQIKEAAAAVQGEMDAIYTRRLEAAGKAEDANRNAEPPASPAGGMGGQSPVIPAEDKDLSFEDKVEKAKKWVAKTCEENNIQV